MKRRFAAVLVILGIVSAIQAQELVISIEKSELGLLQPVKITAELRNNSQENIFVGRRGRYLDYDIYVKDGLHNLVQDTHYKRWMKAQAVDDSFDRILRPGKSEKWTVPVNLLYDMTRPGIYFVETFKNIKAENQGKPLAKRLRSNELKVIIASEFENPFADENTNNVPE